jgi:hypothetical protein
MKVNVAIFWGGKLPYHQLALQLRIPQLEYGVKQGDAMYVEFRLVDLGMAGR